jgi:hypothetical protein
MKKGKSGVQTWAAPAELFPCDISSAAKDKARAVIKVQHVYARKLASLRWCAWSLCVVCRMRAHGQTLVPTKSAKIYHDTAKTYD